MDPSALPPAVRPFLDPSFYPHPVERVDVLQTHISYVFLAGDYAYKVKKAVDFGFLDYSTLPRRRYYCRREVELNRRYCPHVYLGVAAVREEDGRLSLDGRGRPVEYAVKMRRVPEGRMLHRLLEAGRATSDMLAAVARRLAEAHAEAPTGPHVGRYGTWAIAYAWRENFQQWQDFVGETITPQQDALLRGYVLWFLRRRRPLLRLRAAQGRVRECHGDLRSESVVVWPDGSVCIMDCIEFSRRLRYTDVAGDVAFLAMDLEFRGRPDLAEAFVAAYLEASGDSGLTGVLDFYRCYRAAVRGKVEGLLLRQPEVPPREREAALARARRYFDLACRYAARDWPALLITCGLAGSGKSTLAAALGLPVVSSDVVRKELAGLAPDQPARAPWQRGLYAPSFTRRTYAEMLSRAEALLRDGKWAVLDATFLRRWQREAARRLARQQGVRFLCLELRADDELVRRRLSGREGAGGPSDADWQIYLRQKEALEPPDELPPEERLVLDASWPPQEQAAAVRRALGL
ncbi:MAG TPA: AAA family ATPase [Dehalococcoidia bacterium]|nr:AAA family ATPase [Dehalococcoidia bacterium]